MRAYVCEGLHQGVWGWFCFIFSEAFASLASLASHDTPNPLLLLHFQYLNLFLYPPIKSIYPPYPPKIENTEQHLVKDVAQNTKSSEGAAE